MKSLTIANLSQLSKETLMANTAGCGNKLKRDGKITANEITHCPYCGLNLNSSAQNKPLTLEQLRQMNDERVWVQFHGIGIYGLVAYHADPDDGYDGDDVYVTNNLGGRNTIEEIIKQGGKVYASKPDDPVS